MARKKISVIGGGFTGATTAFIAAQKELGDIILVDVPSAENVVKGKALDMLESAPILGFDSFIIGTSNYEVTRDSDIVIITAGIARKPGMTRDELVQVNQEVMKTVTKEVVHYSPNAVIIVLTNPVDAMAYTVYQASGFPKERVIGQSGVLDTARFRSFVASELNISTRDITGFVLGGHGDTMVPLIRYSSVSGVPLTKLLEEETIERIVERTRKGGAEIVELLGNGSAYYAPAAAIVEMAEAILKDQKRILPAVAYLDGEYGEKDLYLGVPVVLGEGGAEQIVELDLNETEQADLKKSAQAVREVIKALK